jgi:hypothetical protein
MKYIAFESVETLKTLICTIRARYDIAQKKKKKLRTVPRLIYLG